MSVTRKGVKFPDRIKTLFNPAAVKAGVLAGATYPENTFRSAKTGRTILDARGGAPVASVAAALEYGIGQNHPRPFMHLTKVRYYRDWAKLLRESLLRGGDRQTALRIVGQQMRDDIQKTIGEWPQDNSASWAAIKGFNHGLIQTGHLQNSIEFEVSADGSENE